MLKLDIVGEANPDMVPVALSVNEKPQTLTWSLFCNISFWYVSWCSPLHDEEKADCRSDNVTHLSRLVIVVFLINIRVSLL